MTTTLPFHLRSETLGFDRPKPWSAPALHLLFNVPRVYEPLLTAWERRNPGSKVAMRRLTEMGFVAYQDPVILDTITGLPAAKAERAVERYRITAQGRRLLAAIAEDSGALQEFTPKTSPENRLKVQALLASTDLTSEVAPYGVSSRYIISRCDLAERTARWWISRLTDGGYLRLLETKVPDVREVIPAHWRATRVLGRHLSEIAEERSLPGAVDAMKAQYRLGRSRYLDEIDPTRVGLGGATDYDHDIGTQQILAELMRSPRMSTEGVFTVEPRFRIATDKTVRPWRFVPDGESSVPYQPDAEYREYHSGGVQRAVLEFERYQRRRDGWAHIERFLGWVGSSLPPFEKVVLRFVVDSDPRARSYAELVEAFSDWLGARPEYRVVQQVGFEVASKQRLLQVPDPLDPAHWYRITPPRATPDIPASPVLHPIKQSPYHQYF